MFYFFILIIFLFSAGCDNVNKKTITPGERIDLVAPYFQTLPQVDSTFSDGGTTNTFFREYFAMQCFNGADINVCPPDQYFKKINAGSADPKSPANYKFIDRMPMKFAYLAYSELDMIYRTNDYYKTCSIASGTSINVNGPQYSPEGSNTYLLNFGDKKDCLGFIMGSFYIYSSQSPSKVVALTRVTPGAVIKYAVQTDILWSILQIYIQMDASGSPRFAVLNSVDFTESKHNDPSVTTNYAVRTIALANLQSHRFVLKNIQTGSQLVGTSIVSLRKALVAIGSAGWDSSTENWRTGNFMFKASDADPESALDTSLYCVSNDLQRIENDLSACNSNDSFLSDFQKATSGDWDALVAYLDISREDVASVANLSLLFDGGTYLDSDDTTVLPADNSLFPRVIRP